MPGATRRHEPLVCLADQLHPPRRECGRLGQPRRRFRWKLENEGFNLQKNGGFALERAYSPRPGPIKNWYLLLQIAHFILPLPERGKLRGQAAARLFGSPRDSARRLAESLRQQLIPGESLDPARCAAV